MSTIELRYSIIENLLQIEDVSFLKEVRRMIESKAKGEIYELSEYQKERIRLARKQFENGETISNEKLQTEISQWLATK